MTNKLAGKVAIVTGASKGIGAAIATSLAAEGASVVVNYANSKPSADEVVASITARGGRAIAVQGDISKPGDVRGVVDAAVSTYGRIDILVNNAGIYEFAPLEAVTEEHYRKVFELNVLGLLLMSQAAAAHLGEGGSIINIGAGITEMKPPGSAVYAGSKSAAETITGVLAKELGPKRIRVNSVSPGPIETMGTLAMKRTAMADSLTARTPLGRLGKPDDIAPIVVFLASDDARWITGDVIAASGGLH